MSNEKTLLFRVYRGIFLPTHIYVGIIWDYNTP